MHRVARAGGICRRLIPVKTWKRGPPLFVARRRNGMPRLRCATLANPGVHMIGSDAVLPSKFSTCRQFSMLFLFYFPPFSRAILFSLPLFFSFFFLAHIFLQDREWGANSKAPTNHSHSQPASQPASRDRDGQTWWRTGGGESRDHAYLS
jgi:hypothetical protein